jgi:hypothetical protein
MKRQFAGRFRSRVVGLAAGGACVAALLAPARSHGQTVIGDVADEAGAAIRGVFVRLLDEQGVPRSGILSNQDGRFVIRAPASGSYRLVAERIGLATVTTEMFELGLDSPHRISIRLKPSAIPLDGIVASERPRCDLRSGEGSALFALWQEARKAFRVVAHARDAQLFRLHVRRYEREVDPESDVVLLERAGTRVGYWSGSPFRALDAERLLIDGFVQPSDDGSVMYYLPDVDVLLSDAFQAVHCFQLMAGPDQETIGIAIEPQGRRDGLHGRLWLDRRTHEVRRLDFSLDRRGLRVRGTPAATGWIDFEGLPSGGWIVRRWEIAMPLMGTRTVRWGGEGVARPVVVRIRKEGAEATDVVTATDEVVTGVGMGALRGRVFDEESDSPLSGATVRLEGTDHAARSDEHGRFAIQDVPSGRYSATFDHPSLARFGLSFESTVIDVLGVTPLDLVVRPGFREARLRERCSSLDPDGAAARDAGIIVGEVRNARTGEPLRGVEVQVYWDRYAIDVGIWRYRDGVSVRTEHDGSFIACGLATDRPVRIVIEGSARAAHGQEHAVNFAESGSSYTHVSIRANPARVR